jgi:uncharacterized protein YkwD
LCGPESRETSSDSAGSRNEVAVKKFSLLLILFLISSLFVSAQRVDRRSVTIGTTSVYSGNERPRVVADPPTETDARSLLAVERRTFDLINNEREKRGLRPLQWSDDAARLARLHSRNMAQNHFFGHRGLDGLMVDDRAEQLGIFNWRAIGENLAFNRGYEQPAEFAVQNVARIADAPGKPSE